MEYVILYAMKKIITYYIKENICLYQMINQTRNVTYI